MPSPGSHNPSGQTAPARVLIPDNDIVKRWPAAPALIGTALTAG